MSDEKQAAAGEQGKQQVDENTADTIDANDPHKAEKLANVGNDTDAAEESE